MDNRIVDFAISSPQRAAKIIASLGIYEDAKVYMLGQDLHGELLRNVGKEVAEMFADEFFIKTGLKLACRSLEKNRVAELSGLGVK